MCSNWRSSYGVRMTLAMGLILVQYAIRFALVVLVCSVLSWAAKWLADYSMTKGRLTQVKILEKVAWFFGLVSDFFMWPLNWIRGKVGK